MFAPLPVRFHFSLWFGPIKMSNESIGLWCRLNNQTATEQPDKGGLDLFVTGLW